jgi:hypothetical protein
LLTGLEGAMIGDFENPEWLELKNRPQRSIGIYKELRLIIPASIGKERIK